MGAARLKISDLDPDHLSQDQIAQLLFPGWRDDGESGDCIFVFGSKYAVNFRVPKAVSLYQAGRAPRILCSGGAVWEGVGEPEALTMKRTAVHAGSGISAAGHSPTAGSDHYLSHAAVLPGLENIHAGLDSVQPLSG